MRFSSEKQRPGGRRGNPSGQEGQAAAKLAAIVESSEDAIISKTLEGVVETWNRGAERMFGYTAQEIVGQPIAKLIPEERQAEEREILERVRRGEHVAHFETVRIGKDGRHIEVSLTVSPIKDASGKVIGASKVARDITERKAAEQALRASEARYKALFEVAQDAIFLVEGERFVECNSKTLAMFGCRREEIIGHPPWRFSPPVQEDGRDSREKAMKKIQAALAGQPQFFEWRHCRADGVKFEAEVLLNRVQIDQHPLLFATVRDISERKRTEKAQQRHMEFDALITKILARFAAFTGLAIDEQIQKSMQEVSAFIGADAAYIVLTTKDMAYWSMIHEVCAPGVPSIREKCQHVPMGQRPWLEQRLMAGEVVQIATPEDYPREAVMERRDSEREGSHSALWLPLRGVGEQFYGCIGLRTYATRMDWLQEDIRRLRIFADALTNVLERQRVESEWYASRQLLQQILDTIPQRVFWKDLHSNYLGCNRSFAMDAGLPDAHAIIGKTDDELPWGGEHAEKFRTDDRRVMESGVEQIGFEEPQLRLDGKVWWVRTSKIPLRDRQNRIFGVLGTYEDITALRQAREALEQAKESAEAANRAKDQFIAVLSHELRTPLTPVLAIVTALQETKRLPVALRENLEMIYRNVQLEASLIDDLLDVTRIAQGKITLRRETVDAHACLRSVLEIFESAVEAKHLTLAFALDAREHFVLADPVRLRQVFWNLFSNAIKFTPAHGRIEVRSCEAGSRLRIEVADSGIGIEPDVLPRIFHAFEQGEMTRTRRFGGLGLGLSIAKSLVEMHQGALSALSEGRDKGAVFVVELETVAPVAERQKVVEVFEKQPREPRRILLVEDHEDTLEILARLLRRWGYGVTTASSVQSALERASEQHFDLLVSDLGLPDGSGYDVMRALKERYKLPAVALSGYGTDEDIRTSLDAGFTEHLTKPVSFQMLRTVVQRLVDLT